MSKEFMIEKKYSIQINNKIVEFTKGETILEVAKNNGVYIPTLCYIEDLPPYGGCRLCIVKVDGMNGYPTACTTPAIDGMKIITNDDEIQELRREILKLLLSEHPYSCIVCDKKDDCEKIRKGVSKFGRMFGCFSCANKDNCELRRLAEYLEISDLQYPMEYHNFPIKIYFLIKFFHLN